LDKEIMTKKTKPINTSKIIEAIGFVDSPNPVTLFELRYSTCRYIIKDGGFNDKIYCGNIASLRSYCKHHYRICYVKARR